MMPHEHISEELSELASLCAIGALPDEEALAFEQHAQQCAVCGAELAVCREVSVAIALHAPPAAPPPQLRERLLRSIQPPPGVKVLRAAQGKWRSTGFPGVTVKSLHRDSATQQLTVLLKLEPGAVYPAHRHAEAEQCLVLEGDVRIGNLVLHAGDYERADATTTHDPIETDGGCLLLIIANQRDELILS